MFDNRRLERLERKLDLIMRHLQITDPDAPQHISSTVAPGEGIRNAEIDELLAQGKKIQAIKVYRDLHPELGLKQAKDAIEARERRYF
ncbi:hypothetical protein [Nocardia sp. N2S4-5]|uniref:hypothetical protein n=1 Tax=Nocardia sp. N2S4-5 TaxID=3351565 RepID=UPI0037D174AE